MLDKINENIKSLNNSRFFAGIIMLMLNIGSKYITISLSKTQEEYLKNSVGRQILIFSIAWMGSRDIYLSIGLTAAFTILSDYLFNEESNLCILPQSMRAFRDELDTNNDGVVSDIEVKAALKILQKAKDQEYKNNQSQMISTLKQQQQL